VTAREGGGNWNGGDHVGVFQPSGKWGSDTNGLDRGNGLICRNSDNQSPNCTTMSGVTDGTSNTLAVGETIAKWCQHTWWNWFNASTATCGIPLNYRRGQGASYLEAQAGDWGRDYSFFSHVAGRTG